MSNENLWCFELADKIFTYVKTVATHSLIDEFPNIFFTQSSINEGNAKYPTIYIHELPGSEVGQDLVNETINAIDYNMQVEVITDNTQEDARVVVAEIADIFKGMGFNLKQFPTFDNSITEYRTIMRVGRVIGKGNINSLFK